jgi:hypothetical protein
MSAETQCSSSAPSAVVDASAAALEDATSCWLLSRGPLSLLSCRFLFFVFLSPLKVSGLTILPSLEESVLSKLILKKQFDLEMTK